MDSRERLLRVLRLLEKYSNSEQGITMDQILQELTKEDTEQTFERKAIYRDLDIISELTELKVIRKAGVKKYKVLRKNTLTQEEVEIITNSLLTAKFISKEETEEIITKLHRLVGHSRDKSLPKIRLDYRVKNEDIDVIQNIKRIRDAIKQNKKIRFDYVKYSVNVKQEGLNQEGVIPKIEKENCVVSPYENVWYQDFYYLLGCFEEKKISHYRIDRMENIQILGEKRKNISEILGPGREFNVAEYMSRIVGMSSGYEEHVKLRFRNEHLSEVIDRFGNKVRIKQEGSEHFLMRAKLVINKKLKHWVLSFGSGVVVLQPDELRKEISEMIQDQVKNYQ